MPILHAIILGIVQGLAEFLPISSSGHLLLVPWAFGWTELQHDPELEKAFDLALHLGTFFGAFWYFRKDMVNLAAAGVRSILHRRIEGADEKMAWMVALSSVPAAVTGVLFDDLIVEKLGAEWLIGVMLIVFGFVLLWCDRRAGERGEEAWRPRDALLMGIAQAAALQPGVSRSGATMSMARSLGFERPAAARLSFLMSLPIILGAAVYSLAGQLADEGIPSEFVPAFAWGTLASAITGFVAVWGTLRFLRTRSFTPFVIYRVIVGIGVIALAASPLR